MSDNPTNLAHLVGTRDYSSAVCPRAMGFQRLGRRPEFRPVAEKRGLVGASEVVHLFKTWRPGQTRSGDCSLWPSLSTRRVSESRLGENRKFVSPENCFWGFSSLALPGHSSRTRSPVQARPPRFVQKGHASPGLHTPLPASSLLALPEGN